jgi:hypothetical protein
MKESLGIFIAINLVGRAFIGNAKPTIVEIFING